MRARFSLKWNRLYRSLYVRLFVILVLTGLLLNGLVGFSFRAMWSIQNPLNQRVLGHWIEHYRELVLRDIGSPPDSQRLKILGEKLSIDLKVWTPDGEAETRSGLPSWSVLEENALRATRWNMSFGRWGDRYFLITAQGPQRLAAFAPPQLQIETKPAAITLLLLLLSFTLFLTYVALSRLLLPLHDLMASSRALAQGRFEVKVPRSNLHEWNELSESFNHMAESLQRIIQRKDQLLRDISHELRSPLTRMRVALSMMEASKYRDSIEQDLKEMDQLIEQILAAARTEAGQQPSAEVDLAALCREAVEQYRLLGVAIEAYGTEQAWLARGDAAALRRVLNNLLDNAMKYAAGAKRPIQVRCLPTENRWIVRDFGPGVHPSELEHLGTVFYRPDPSRSRESGGFGLGLAICKTTLEQHGGRLEMRLPSDGGLEVIVQFPTKDASKP
jgi:signal transduction histidine kinase